MWQGTVMDWASALDVGPDDLSARLGQLVRQVEDAHAAVIGIEAQIVEIPDDVAAQAIQFAGTGLAVVAELLGAALVTAKAEVN